MNKIEEKDIHPFCLKVLTLIQELQGELIAADRVQPSNKSELSRKDIIDLTILVSERLKYLIAKEESVDCSLYELVNSTFEDRKKVIEDSQSLNNSVTKEYLERIKKIYEENSFLANLKEKEIAMFLPALICNISPQRLQLKSSDESKALYDSDNPEKKEFYTLISQARYDKRKEEKRKNDISRFVKIIKKLIKELQPTLPIELSDSEIESIGEIIRAKSLFILDSGEKMEGSLETLIIEAINDGKDGKGDTNINNSEEHEEHGLIEYKRKAKKIVDNSYFLSHLSDEEIADYIPALSFSISEEKMEIATPDKKFNYDSNKPSSIPKNYLLIQQSRYKNQLLRANEGRFEPPSIL